MGKTSKADVKALIPDTELTHEIQSFVIDRKSVV